MTKKKEAIFCMQKDNKNSLEGEMLKISKIICMKCWTKNWSFVYKKKLKSEKCMKKCDKNYEERSPKIFNGKEAR